MRWKKMHALKGATETEADVDEVEEAEDEPSFFIKIPLKLTAEQTATSNYVFASGPDDENNYLYKKLSDDTTAAAKMVAPEAKAVPKANAVSKATGGKTQHLAAVADSNAQSIQHADASIAHMEQALASAKRSRSQSTPSKIFASPSKKRKGPEPDPESEPLSHDDPAFQQAAIQFCMQQMKSRVMAKVKAKRLKKEHLLDYILTFEAGTKGTIDDVVDTFVEQSLCKTDEDEE